MNLHDFSFESQILWLKEHGYLAEFYKEANMNLDFTNELRLLSPENIIRLLIKHKISTGNRESWSNIGLQMEYDMFCSTEFMANEALKELEKAKEKYPEEFL